MKDSIATEARRFKLASDQLAKKPKLYEIPAVSIHERNRKFASAVSVNDILEKYGMTNLMNDPKFREKMYRASEILNSTANRF